MQRVEAYQCRDCGQFWNPAKGYGPTETIDDEGMHGTIAYVMEDAEPAGTKCPHCGSYNSRIAKSERVPIETTNGPGVAPEAPVSAILGRGEAPTRRCPFKAGTRGMEMVLGANPDVCEPDCGWYSSRAGMCAVAVLADNVVNMLEVASLLQALPDDQVEDLFFETIDEEDDQADDEEVETDATKH